MAGLLGLLGFLTLTGASLHDTVQRDLDSSCARNSARNSNKEIYYDGFRNPHWTATDEIVEIIDFQGYRTIKGIKTGTVYKETKPNTIIEAEKREQKIKDGLNYCIQNNLDYYPFFFPNSILGKTKDYCTGIEVLTNKKYVCYKYGNKYILLYLEDNPHEYWQERGGILKEYDAIHDIEGFGFKKGYANNKRQEKGCSDSWYFTKEHKISKEEYKARTKELKEYPYEYYKLK